MEDEATKNSQNFDFCADRTEYSNYKLFAKKVIIKKDERNLLETVNRGIKDEENLE